MQSQFKQIILLIKYLIYIPITGTKFILKNHESDDNRVRRKGVNKTSVNLLHYKNELLCLIVVCFREMLY